MTLSARLPSLLAPVFLMGAVLLGALIAKSPPLAVAAMGLVVVGALPFLFPVAHLVVLLVVLAVVPYEILNQYSFGGGVGAIGISASDMLLFGGLFRAAIVLARQPLTRLQAVAVPLTALLMLVVLAQFVHGVLGQGALMDEAGAEARTLMGFGTLLVALPLVNDQRHRTALLRGLVIAGFVVALWGLAQWTLSITYGAGGNFGVREGVELTSGGRGQLLGGLFSFPVAVVLGVAALLSGEVRARSSRIALAVMVTLNGVCLLLTYERTFWLVTAGACLLVAARAGSHARIRALLWAPVVAALIFVPLATLSPDTLTTGRERLLSLGQYSNDRSVYYRLIESRHVLEQVHERPLAGTGLGAAIYWGRPLYRVPPDRYTFVHNGFLYLGWKLGLVVTGLLVAALLAAILRTRRRIRPPLMSAVVNGAQAALLALLIANLTFPSLASLSGTGTIGALVAICLVPAAPAGVRRLTGGGRRP